MSEANFQSAHEIGKIYQSLTERTSLCSFFLDSTAKFTGADQAFLFLAGRNDQLWVDASLNGGQPEPPVLRQAEEAYESGKPLLSGQVLLVPLIVRNSSLGVAVFQRPAGSVFASGDLDLAVSLASQMAGALKNILLFEENLKMERLAAVGQTTGMVIHEMKNIMQLAKLSYEFMKRGNERKDEKFISRGMTNMEKALRELEGFTLDMLSLTKDYELETEPVDIAKILNELEGDLGDKAKDLGISLEFIMEENFAPVDADARALYRTLLNLVKNAMEASDPAKEKPFVRVQVRSASDGRYEIRVEDNGAGMSPEVKARLFEAFFSTKGSKGTGLGLLIIDRTIKKHHGEIRIESEEKKGTAFILTLPKKFS